MSLLREGMVFAAGREDWLEELADAFREIDALPEALQTLQMASRLCPGDARLRARLKDLAAQLKDGRTATRQLFNQYAADFDHDLAALRYTAPKQIAEMLVPFTDRFTAKRVVDLGCGTGLMGQYLRVASPLIGVDLSPAMLEEARGKDIYDELVENDIVAYCQLPQAQAALVTAADVLVYIGDLQPLFFAVSKLLARNGLFAFTVERGEGESFTFAKTKRVLHSESYIRKTAENGGFRILQCNRIVPRYDRKKPVKGLMVLLELL